MIITICIDTSGEAFASGDGPGVHVAALLRRLADSYAICALNPEEGDYYGVLSDSSGERCGVLTHLERSR